MYWIHVVPLWPGSGIVRKNIIYLGLHFCLTTGAFLERIGHRTWHRFSQPYHLYLLTGGDWNWRMCCIVELWSPPQPQCGLGDVSWIGHQWANVKKSASWAHDLTLWTLSIPCVLYSHMWLLHNITADCESSMPCSALLLIHPEIRENFHILSKTHIHTQSDKIVFLLEKEWPFFGGIFF